MDFVALQTTGDSFELAMTWPSPTVARWHMVGWGGALKSRWAQESSPSSSSFGTTRSSHTAGFCLLNSARCQGCQSPSRSHRHSHRRSHTHSHRRSHRHTNRRSHKCSHRRSQSPSLGRRAREAPSLMMRKRRSRMHHLLLRILQHHHRHLPPLLHHLSLLILIFHHRHHSHNACLALSLKTLPLLHPPLHPHLPLQLHLPQFKFNLLWPGWLGPSP